MFLACRIINQLASAPLCGAVAQLGERRVRYAKVEGSIPFRSTISSSGYVRRDPRKAHETP